MVSWITGKYIQYGFNIKDVRDYNVINMVYSKC